MTLGEYEHCRDSKSRSLLCSLPLLYGAHVPKGSGSSSDNVGGALLRTGI
jgi:hypothetical protein